MDREAWQATVHGVTKSQTQLSNFHFHFLNLGTGPSRSVKMAGSSPWLCHLVSPHMGEPGTGSLWELLGSLRGSHMSPNSGGAHSLPSVQGSLASVPFKITLDWDFPGDRVVKTLPSNARGVGSIHSWGASKRENPF